MNVLANVQSLLKNKSAYLNNLLRFNNKLNNILVTKPLCQSSFLI